MANKVFNMAGGLHSAAAYSAFENAMYGSCVATANDFVATAGSGMNVSLSAGNGLIATGTGFARRIAADATNTIAISAAASTARIDSIVAYIDNSVSPTTSVVDNTNDILKFTAVSGTAAANPVAPTAAAIQSAIGAGNPYMILWNITVPASATALTNATFTDKRTVASNLDTIAALRNEIDAFKSSLTLTDFNSADTVSLPSGVTNDGKSLTLAQSADSSTFKFYGYLYLSRTASSDATVTGTAIPGLSGYYGIPTGLKLNNPPTEGFRISNAGYIFRLPTSAHTNLYNGHIAVGTDGQIFLRPGTNQSITIAYGAGTTRFAFMPCLYFNTNFGDDADHE